MFLFFYLSCRTAANAPARQMSNNAIAIRILPEQVWLRTIQITDERSPARDRYRWAADYGLPSTTGKTTTQVPSREARR